MTAAAWAVPVLALAGCAAWAARGRIRGAVLRARWAWRCRGRPPIRNLLEQWEREELITIEEPDVTGQPPSDSRPGCTPATPIAPAAGAGHKLPAGARAELSAAPAGYCGGAHDDVG